MFSRRVVEEFRGGEWKDDPEHDGRRYRVQIKLNGEEEPFNFEVSISGTAISTGAEGLEQILRENGWEEIAKRKITHAVRNAHLDGWPPRLMVRLRVESSDLDSLVLPDAL